MIHYDNTDHLRVIFKVKGSVFPKSLRASLFTMLYGLVLALLRRVNIRPEDMSLCWSNCGNATQVNVYIFGFTNFMEHYVAMTILSVVLGYLIVVRTNMALARWMEGIGEVQNMLSYWIDAVTSLFGFFSGSTGDLAFQHRCMLVRMRLAHYFSLMSAIAFAQLRDGNVQGWEPLNISNVVVRPMFPKDAGSMSFAANFDEEDQQKEQQTAKADDKVKGCGLCSGKADAVTLLNVLHVPNSEELKYIILSSDKVNALCLWIIQLVAAEQRNKTFEIPPPILSRVFDELSNSMHAFHQAHKVAMVPFPFPFAQMVDWILAVWSLLLPLYVDCFTRNFILTPMYCFVLPMAFFTLNHVAIELEEPFLLYANSIDLEDRHNEFISVLDDLLRHSTRPPIDAETETLETNVIDGYEAAFGEKGHVRGAVASSSPFQARAEVRRLSQTGRP